jgi:hypothetical protein
VTDCKERKFRKRRGKFELHDWHPGPREWW